MECGKPKLTWVTDLVVLPNANKILLSFTDNMLALYDLATANCDRLVQIVGLPHCVLHMDYWCVTVLNNHTTFLYTNIKINHIRFCIIGLRAACM